MVILKLATKNIPANAVDKIDSVLKNFSEVGQLRGVQNNQDNIALNIKLKKGKDKLLVWRYYRRRWCCN